MRHGSTHARPAGPAGCLEEEEMNRFLVSMLSAFLLITGCSEQAGRILAPDGVAERRTMARERVLLDDIILEDSVFASDFTNDVQLSAAGSVIVAAGSMDYSFTLRFRRFTGAGCTGGADLFTNVFGVSDFGFAIDFPARLSAQLEAATSANDGTPFHRWEGPAGFVSANRTICVDMPAGVDTYLAFFEVPSGNTAPLLASIGAHTVDELETLMFLATATDTDVPAQALMFSLRNGAAGLVPEGATMTTAGAFSWTPAEAQGPGTSVFDVCVRDDGSPSLEACETVTVQVLEVNSPPTVDPVGPFLLKEGEALTFLASASDVDVPTNALVFSLSGAPGGAMIDPASGSFTWVPEDDAGSPFTFAVVVTDEGGASGQTDVTVNVENVSPQVTSLSGVPVAPVPTGLVQFGGSFGDPSLVDVHALAIDCDHGGQGLPGTGSIDGAARTWTGTCTFTAPGIHHIRIEITDDDGGSGAVIADPVVVFDPDGGFVTGGGWFDSPAGAFTADPGLTAPAHFGFVSRYRKGAPSPGGNTEFTIRNADLHFRSTSYEWLVVAGNQAHFRGTGEIDGNPNYNFEIMALDGDPKSSGDRIRIRIWHGASGALVYDNAVNGNNGPESSSAVIQGSIVIHDGKITVQQKSAKR
jgi:hypothetical protein